MPLKKFHGKSIEDARRNARNELGRHFTIVETKGITDQEQAWVHVLSEGANEKPVNPLGTYSRRDLFPKALTKLKDTLNDSFKLFEPTIPRETQHTLKEGKKASSVSSSSFYDARPQKALANDCTKKRTQASATTSKYDSYSSSNSELQELNRRFDKLEQMVSDQVMGINSRYISHPAFQQLLRGGVPRTMIVAWFNTLLQEGLAPYHSHGDFSRRLAENVKKTLSISADTKPASIMTFTGAAGSGKSSLIVKLALHQELLQQAACVLVSVVNSSKHIYTPLQAYASEYDISHHVVCDPPDLESVVEEAPYDHLLIEMPSINNAEASFKQKLQKFQKILSDYGSEVHRVINATQHQDYLKGTKELDSFLPATHIDFTQLDGTTQVGHLLPLMQDFNGKARYMSIGPNVPEDIAYFEPGYFAKRLLTT